MSIGFNLRILTYTNRLTNSYRLLAFDIAAISLLLRNEFYCFSMPSSKRDSTVTKGQVIRGDSKNIKQLVAEAVELWKQKYKNKITALKVEITDIKVSQAFISKKYDDLSIEHQKLL